MSPLELAIISIVVLVLSRVIAFVVGLLILDQVTNRANVSLLGVGTLLTLGILSWISGWSLIGAGVWAIVEAVS